MTLTTTKAERAFSAEVDRLALELRTAYERPEVIDRVCRYARVSLENVLEITTQIKCDKTIKGNPYWESRIISLYRAPDFFKCEPGEKTIKQSLFFHERMENILFRIWLKK